MLKALISLLGVPPNLSTKYPSALVLTFLHISASQEGGCLSPCCDSEMALEASRRLQEDQSPVTASPGAVTNAEQSPSLDMSNLVTFPQFPHLQKCTKLISHAT